MSIDRHSPGFVSPTAIRALIAVDHLHATTGHANLTGVAEAIDRARATTYRHLLRLSELGLIDWDGAGTLRPAVTVVACQAPHNRPERTHHA